MPDPSVAVPLVHEDEHLLVVDKPAGLVVHPGAGQRSGTLVHGLLARFPEIAAWASPTRPGIVHRLDKGTSGLLLVARTQAAYEALVAALAARTVHRRYRALAWGHVEAPRGLIDAPIGRSTRRADPDGRRRAGQGGPHALRGAGPLRRAGRGHRAGLRRSRRAAPTRSASTCAPSATRWWATRATTAPASRCPCAARSSTPSSLGLEPPRHRRAAERSTSPLPADLTEVLGRLSCGPEALALVSSSSALGQSRWPFAIDGDVGQREAVEVGPHAAG